MGSDPLPHRLRDDFNEFGEGAGSSEDGGYHGERFRPCHGVTVSNSFESRPHRRTTVTPWSAKLMATFVPTARGSATPGSTTNSSPMTEPTVYSMWLPR